MKNFDSKNIPFSSLQLPSIWHGEIPLFNSKDAQNLLTYCEQNKIGILGIEGFNLENGFRIPNQDYIIDFSEFFKKNQHEFLKKSITISKKFTQTTSGDIFFEFTFTEIENSTNLEIIEKNNIYCLNEEKEIIWHATLPKFIDFQENAKESNFITEETLKKGSFKYLNGISDNCFVVVFQPLGGMDWNIWYDQSSGQIKKITESR